MVLKNAVFAKSNMMFDSEDTSALRIRLLKRVGDWSTGLYWWRAFTLCRVQVKRDSEYRQTKKKRRKEHFRKRLLRSVNFTSFPPHVQHLTRRLIRQRQSAAELLSALSVQSGPPGWTRCCWVSMHAHTHTRSSTPSSPWWLHHPTTAKKKSLFQMLKEKRELRVSVCLVLFCSFRLFSSDVAFIALLWRRLSGLGGLWQVVVLHFVLAGAKDDFPDPKHSPLVKRWRCCCCCCCCYCWPNGIKSVAAF